MVCLQVPKAAYSFPSGSTLSKYTVADKKMEEMVKGGSQFAVSANGEKLLFKVRTRLEGSCYFQTARCNRRCGTNDYTTGTEQA